MPIDPPDENTTLADLLDALEPHAHQRYGENGGAMYLLLADLRELHDYRCGEYSAELGAVLAQIEDLDASSKRAVLRAALDAVPEVA